MVLRPCLYTTDIHQCRKYFLYLFKYFSAILHISLNDSVVIASMNTRNSTDTTPSVCSRINKSRIPSYDSEFSINPSWLLLKSGLLLTSGVIQFESPWLNGHFGIMGYIFWATFCVRSTAATFSADEATFSVGSVSTTC